jgi:PAS domain S-box-containing protein
LQDLKTRTRNRTKFISGRGVTLLVNSRMFQLSGCWNWDLHSDHIFCSDVIISKPFDYAGSKSLLHPDDKESLYDIIFSQACCAEISFRVITTYGEVKFLKGNKIDIEMLPAGLNPVEEGMIQKAEEEKQFQHLQLLNKINNLAERDTGTGTWYYNVNTGFAWYSPQVFRIFEIAPDSADQDLYCFRSCIHPEEQEIVSAYLDLSFRNKTPIQISYRIVTPGGEKTVMQITNWTYSQKGEEICCGTFQLINEQKDRGADSGERSKENGSEKKLFTVDELTHRVQRAEVRINNLLDSLNEGFFELDQQFRFISINPAAADFIHKKREEILGQSFTDLFPETRDSNSYKAMRKVMIEKLTLKGEYFCEISDKWIYASISPTENGIAVLFFDIQNIREAEMAVKENEYLLQEINQATPDAITLYNLELKQPIYLNNSMSEWTGFSNDELIRMGIEGRLQLVHPEDRDKLVAFNQLLLTMEDKEIKSIDYRLLTSKGQLWIRNRSKIFKRNSHGKVLHTLSILQDVTREVNLLKELKERTTYAETIIDASIDQIKVLDTDLNIIAWNKKSETICGLEKSFVLGKNIFDVFPGLMEDTDTIHGFREALTGNFVRFSARKTSCSGGFFEFYFIPLKNAEGKVYAFLHMSHDVSEFVAQSEELKNLNRTLENKNRELEQKHDEITNFSFIASHDLKEPLRKIHTFADWLLENEVQHFSDTGKNFLDKLQVSVKRMERLIEDVLVLMKINNNHEEIEEVDLNEVYEKVKCDLQENIDEKKALVSADHLPMVRGNSNQLFYLFRNIIINAMKFQANGNIPQITISTIVENKPDYPNEKFCRISFSDNGLGFNKKYSKKIFMVFQRLHNKSQFDGTGIGLAMCKKIMENHHGMIRVESEEGIGSVFHCYFPLQDKQPGYYMT